MERMTTQQAAKELNINVVGAANIEVEGDANIKSKMNVSVDADGEVLLGKNKAKLHCNNIENCFVTGILHNIGNTNVKC